MESPKVLVLPEVEDFLEEMPRILLAEGYASFYENAKKIKDDVLSNVLQIPTMIHYDIDQRFAYHFAKYGDDLKYSFFKRKSSPHTTWYVFYTIKGNRYIVKHISTNWTEGQYIR